MPLLHHPFQPTPTVTFLVCRQMTQTIILQIQHNLKVTALIPRQLDILPLKSQLSLPFQKIQVKIDPSHSLTPRPTEQIQFNENVRQQQLCPLLYMLVESQLLVD